jgi:HEAT repeat protein
LDLSPLKGMKLTGLDCGGTRVSDLSPLKGMPLTGLDCRCRQVSDLSPLKGMKLTFLACDHTQVSDLSPLKDMQLTHLSCRESRVSDLSPLRGMPLKEVYCDFRPERDAEILRSLKTLETINFKPAAQFWKELGGSTPAAESNAGRVEETSKPPPKDGFVPLFNGKDLTGWKDERNRTGQWSEDGGTILGWSPSDRDCGYLLTEEDYGDFVLRFEFKVEAGSQGAVAIRATPEEKLGGGLVFHHPIIKLSSPAMDTKEPTGTTHWLKSTAADVRPIGVLLLPSEEWHSMEVTVQGGHCTASVNRKKLVDLTLDPASPTSGKDVPGLGRKRGKVGFQINTGTVRFRNIEIKELPANRPPQRPVNLTADASIADLRRALKSEDPAVQETAAGLLAERGPEVEPAVHDLADTLTNEKNPTKVRELAAIALGHLKEKAEPAVPALVKTLKPPTPTKVRQYAAEALYYMRYPANEEAIPAVLEAIRKDTDTTVRQRCVWALFELKDLERFGADKVLAEVLETKDEAGTLLRYDAARCLAYLMGPRAPARTADVLLHWLRNKGPKHHLGTDVQGAAIVGGDARYMAAESLGWLKDSAAKRKDVIDALKEATKDKDEKLRAKATAALRSLGVP